MAWQPLPIETLYHHTSNKICCISFKSSLADLSYWHVSNIRLLLIRSSFFPSCQCPRLRKPKHYRGQTGKSLRRLCQDFVLSTDRFLAIPCAITTFTILQHLSTFYLLILPLVFSTMFHPSRNFSRSLVLYFSDIYHLSQFFCTLNYAFISSIIFKPGQTCLGIFFGCMGAHRRLFASDANPLFRISDCNEAPL